MRRATTSTYFFVRAFGLMAFFTTCTVNRTLTALFLPLAA